MSLRSNKNDKNIKKKGSKRVANEDLGFKEHYVADLINFTNRKRQYRSKKTATKSNFMAKLTLFFEMNEYPALKDPSDSLGAKWNQVRKVIYRTRREIQCCICMDQFIAPKITKCGHIYCWHCIYMHFQKSLKAINCPICNEFFELKELKSCSIMPQKTYNPGDQIQFGLRVRDVSSDCILQASSMEQDLNLTRVAYITAEGLRQVYQQEQKQIYNAIQKDKESDTINWLVKVLSLCQNNIKTLENYVPKKIQCKEPYLVKNNFMCRYIDEITPKMIRFYQQAEGKYTYLHPICQRFLFDSLEMEDLPLRLQTTILLLEQAEYTEENSNKYKSLNHLPLNQDINVVFVELAEYISAENNQAYQKEYKQYLDRKKRIEEIEEKKAQQRKLQYEQEQEYLKKLKRMQIQQTFIINMPIQLDPEEINSHQIFPSLISDYQNKQEGEETKIEKQNSSKEKPFKATIEDFPDILATSKSDIPPICVNNQEIKQQSKEVPKTLNVKQQSEDFDKSKRGKAKKRKKENFVDMTEYFFSRNQDQ